jgi:hypothetical protein
MTKRPSLFSTKPAALVAVADEPQPPAPSIAPAAKRPPSREGKRVLSVYLDPIAWKQLRQLALDNETSTQELGEQAINLLFQKHGLNRSA